MPLEESYESLGVIADALYGDVYKLRNRRTREFVACKRVELAYAAAHRTKDTLRAIEEDIFTEVQTNLKIRALGGHENIVEMVDCIAEETTVSLLTEFCDAGELLDVINARGTLLEIDEVLRYFYQILSAVDFIHRNGVAHRDLSLENVLVDSKDNCKLSDFGMSTTQTVVAATGVGKVHYMAPEAIRVSGDLYNPFRSDIWSLGVIFFTLLVGQYPFSEPVPEDAQFRLLETLGVEFLLERCDFETYGQEDLVDLLKQMLVMDPRERASASTLLAHPCFAQLKIENDSELETEDEDMEEVDATINPAHDKLALAIWAPMKMLPSMSMAASYMLRRPAPINTSCHSSCAFVAPTKSGRQNSARQKEERAARNPFYQRLSRRRRRSPKPQRSFALRAVFDGVFRWKKPSSTTMT
ncbi:hypothetical protein Poli38472_009011 [Pythium oligandrum]|uniref:Protein kinase domain-containing protein n=1 Tax=Pythium oligandrum TaxID=41045 RepID=A0A8K1FL37_PYTOL|nr:hypothetical protein Poli38472_009011 [Pythium oligandrum]|eukprot:TMW64844.1 hypothetical protein Poli38472_009011 [Pythium oligandrum]